VATPLGLAFLQSIGHVKAVLRAESGPDLGHPCRGLRADEGALGQAQRVEYFSVISNI
jgi:hypothetical protein